MENTPFEAKVEYADLAAASQAEAEAARNYLDDAGIIDYARFGQETRDVLAAGPGYVTEPAPVKPYHKDTTTEEFAHNSNNFHVTFDAFWGESYREHAFYQRFSILFPNFTAALLAQHKEYVARCMALDPPFYKFDPEMFEPLRTAYGIMSQLIDQNDTYFEDQLVRDIDATKILRS